MDANGDGIIQTDEILSLGYQCTVSVVSGQNQPIGQADPNAARNGLSPEQTTLPFVFGLAQANGWTVTSTTDSWDARCSSSTAVATEVRVTILNTTRVRLQFAASGGRLQDGKDSPMNPVVAASDLWVIFDSKC